MQNVKSALSNPVVYFRLASSSAELEVNVFWSSEELWEVPPSYSVNFCAFSFLPLSRSGSRISEQSGGNMKSSATLVAFTVWQKLILFLLPSQISQWVLDTFCQSHWGRVSYPLPGNHFTSNSVGLSQRRSTGKDKVGNMTRNPTINPLIK